MLSTDFTELRSAGGSQKAVLMTMVDINTKWAPGWRLALQRNSCVALACWEEAEERMLHWQPTMGGLTVHHDKHSVYTNYDWVRTLLLADGVRMSVSENGAQDNPVDRIDVGTAEGREPFPV